MHPPLKLSLSRQLCHAAASGVADIIESKRTSTSPYPPEIVSLQTLCKVAALKSAPPAATMYTWGRLHGMIGPVLKKQRQKAEYERAVSSGVAPEHIASVESVVEVDNKRIYLVSLKLKPAWDMCWVAEDAVPMDLLQSFADQRKQTMTVQLTPKRPKRKRR